MNWVELIVFIILTVLFFALVYDNLRIRLKLQKTARQLTQQLIDYNAVVEQFQKELKKNDTKKIEETEGFLNFLSESRDWAFQYIDEVQKAIEVLKEASSKVDLSSGGYLLVEELSDFRKAVAEVLRQLPEDSKND